MENNAVTFFDELGLVIDRVGIRNAERALEWKEIFATTVRRPKFWNQWSKDKRIQLVVNHNVVMLTAKGDDVWERLQVALGQARQKPVAPVKD